MSQERTFAAVCRAQKEGGLIVDKVERHRVGPTKLVVLKCRVPDALRLVVPIINPANERAYLGPAQSDPDFTTRYQGSY